MAYRHKKSLRTITDEQFSDGTTVDGSRIDKALEASVGHFNAIPGGDVSTRFVPTQFVFGYQPSGYMATPELIAAPFAARVLRAVASHTEGTTWPWTFVKNSPRTLYDGAIPPGPITVPAGGQQNEWRFKGIEPEPWSDPQIQAPTNEGEWATGQWADWWNFVGGPPVAAKRSVESAYQFAWTHSWQFRRPVIVDSLCILLRTDTPSTGGASGFYDAPFQFAVNTAGNAPTNAVTIQASVENSFATEDRALNDMDINVSGRFMDAYEVTTLPVTKASTPGMLPNSPDEYGASPAGIRGRLIRFRDLNIPIRQFGRLRLSIVIPWFRDQGRAYPADTPGETHGLNTGRISTKLPFASSAERRGFEPMYNFSLNGTMTVLEEVEG